VTTTIRLHVHHMDCADETALIRRALAPVPGVQNLEFDLVRGFVDITFDSSRTTDAALLHTVSATGLHAHLADAAAAPAAAAHEPHAHRHADRTTMATLLSGALLLTGWVIEGAAAEHWLETFVQHTHDARAAVVYALAAAAGLFPMAPRAVASLRHWRLDMHVLVCVSVVGAGIIGEWSEGAAVAFLFALAHRIEAWSIERARAEMAALAGRGPSLVAEGPRTSARMERWIESFAATYTPAVTGAAFVVAVVPPLVVGDWMVWFYRALVFLVLACPCALVISTPVTMVSALASAARRGVLVSSGAALERAAAAGAATPEALQAAGVTVARAREGRAAIADVVVVTTGDDHAMEFLIAHARRALRVVRQNVAIALFTKVAFLVSAPLGFAPLWMAVLADTGATVLVTLNGLRLLRATPRVAARQPM
jgi:cation transport ATPase